MGWQIAYVEPVLFIYMLCLFLHYPVQQQMVYHKVCSSHFNQSYCSLLYTGNNNQSDNENLIQEETAKWQIYIVICTTLPSIASTLILGIWSDGIGRKRILMLSVFGEILNAVCNFLNAWYFAAPVKYLLIGCLINGVFGNFAVILMTIFAYIADITTERSRTMRVIVLDSVIFLASCISLLSGGILLQYGQKYGQKYGFVAVYGLVLALYGILIIYIIFLKESYYPTETLKISDVFNRNRIMESFKMFTMKRNDYYRVKLYLLLGCFFILSFQIMGTGSVSILYLLHQPLNFTPSGIGYLSAEVSGMKFIGAILITVILIKLCKWNDHSIILLTSVMVGCFALCFGLSKVAWQVYLSSVCCLGVGVGIPAARARLSKMVSITEQGRMFSFVSVVQVLSIFVADTLCFAIYKYTVHITPSIIFFILAGLSMVSVLFSMMLKLYGQKTTLYEVHVDEIDESNVFLMSNITPHSIND